MTKGPAKGTKYDNHKEIDESELEKLCMLQATGEEIASWFGISVDTLERRVVELGYNTFAEYFNEKRGKGKISLRRSQYQTAMGDRANGIPANVTMQIWLGKQYLGQADKQEIVHGGGIDITSQTPEQRAARLAELLEKRKS